MGNADQLSRAGRAHGLPGPLATPARSWRRTALYGGGLLSMLVLSMASSLSLWIALPWAFLGWSPTLVTSGSMQPLVAPGDVVMVRSATSEELVPNTVVLYERPDTGRVLHRIVEQMPDGTYITRGDANTADDSGFLHAEDVRGAAVLAVPWIGRPSLWLEQGSPVAVTATGVALLVMLALAPRAFDPAYDPWAAGTRVSPAEVLLGRIGGTAADRGAGSSGALLPGDLHDLVLDRLAAQSAAAQRRTAHLVEGLS